MLNRFLRYIFILSFVWNYFTVSAQVNDNCVNAGVITIPNAGFTMGTYYSDTVNLTSATTEFGETYPAGVPNGKSVWYKFSIPTTRTVKITLTQTGSPIINPSDVGWALYRSNTCLPGVSEIVDPPIFNIEGYTHECLRAGDYMIQVSADLAVNGSIFLELDVSQSSAPEIDHDYAALPYDFQIVSGVTLNTVTNHSFDAGCQSVFDAELLCPDTNYTKSTWHVFTTDAFVDYVRFEIGENPYNALDANPRNWGYVLYEGNSQVDSTGLIVVDACKTLTQTNASQYGTTFYPCDLNPNTTYSIQLLYPTDYFGTVNTRIYERGLGLTQSPDPTSIPASHQLGVISPGSNITVSDVFACNALMSNNLCGTVVPDSFVTGGYEYDLNIWTTFELSQDMHMYFWSQLFEYSPNIYFRIYQGDVTTGGCNIPLDTEFFNSLHYNCMPAGKYSLQILGTFNETEAHTWRTHIGKNINIHFEATQPQLQLFGLHSTLEADSINGGVPLVSGNTYTSTQDYFDCQTTYLPAGSHCNAANDRAIYRIIEVDQSGILSVGGGNWIYFRYKLYQGDARIEPIVGNEIQNLTDLAACQSTYYPFKVCVTPGTYTLVSYGDISDVGRGDNPWIRFETFAPTSFTDPNNPEILDTLSNSNTSVTGTGTRFDCNDNPLTILGYTPCSGATKQVYREFYLADPAAIQFISNHTAYQNEGGVSHRIFQGRISDGSLTGLLHDCTGGFSTDACNPLSPGWYTVVTYAYGETYVSPQYSSGRGGSIGNLTNVSINIIPPLNSQKYYDFANAEQVNGGNPIFWEMNIPGGHTSQIPLNNKTYTLGTEYWDCTDNLPFEAGITACNASHNRVSYRVFTLSKPSYVFIYNLNPYPYGYQSVLYDGDITGTSAPYLKVQDCITDQMRLCLAPGTYTLATFAGDNHIGRSHTPVIYLDSLGYSKHNHAAFAYDFDNIPNDNVQYKGKPGDPNDAFGRAPSNDFFFCTTDAETTDPIDVCPIGTPPPGNSLPNPTEPRRNLWYTFTVTGPGQVDVSLYNLTLGKSSISPFAIYKSDDLNFPVVVDSTVADGLSLVGKSTYYYCYNNQTVSFYRDPCTYTAGQTDRYYVLVDAYDYNGSSVLSEEPDLQVEMGIKFEPAPPSFVLYDHYSDANVITGNPTAQCSPPYTPIALGSGTYTGCTGNLNCATKDATDQNPCGNHTIWYKFDVSASGKIRLNYDRPDASITDFQNADMELYYEAVPGDSSSSGLVKIPLTRLFRNDNPDFNPGTSYAWGEACIQPGTYYIMFTGCNFPTEQVTPRIWIEETPGDLCGQNIALDIPGPGSYDTTMTVDCFTIGEAPGEDGSNMGCLSGPVNYKSGWFYVDVTDTTKMDINIELDEYTTASSNQINYRIAYGDCNSMSFDNCVDEGTFIILNLKCRTQGSFWIQVVMPDYATGTIDLHVTATPNPDTSCTPYDGEKPNANFDFVAGCEDVEVEFLNQSTTGDSVAYFWDFGDGYTSTQKDPVHTYTAPSFGTFLVTLVVTKDSLTDTTQRYVIVYPKPQTHFTFIPSPTVAGDAITFTNQTTDTISTSTYYWSFCAGGSPCSANIPSYSGINPPPITYSIPGTYTVCLTVTNGNCDSTYCEDIVVESKNIFAGGPYDGFAESYYTDSCYNNIFAGGPYDGFDIDSLTCSVTNIFVGGPYDGFAEVIYSDSCYNNIFAGGPYDGFDKDTISCVPINIYAGGPYDGFAEAIYSDSCFVNIFAGGPYDGFDSELHRDTCWTTTIFSGGPFDGFAMAESLACPIPLTIYAGGPYDGFAEAVLTDSCYNNIFTGGPYDGFDKDTISCEVVNIFAGNPYDGYAEASLSGFFVLDDNTCIGEQAILVSSAPTDWYDQLTGGNLLATNVDSFYAPISDYTETYYAVDVCGGSGRLAAVAYVQDSVNANFADAAGCVGESSYFTNQSIITGTSTPSFGNQITSFGTHGTAPNIGQLTFQSAQYANFSYLSNNIHEQYQAWTANNSGAGTVWTQWNYVTARSVNRVVFWARNNCCSNKIPTQARLYYSAGGPWKLVKVFDTQNNSPNGYFDSGTFCESNGIFANRWKIEFDVDVANAPSFGEFQVWSGLPVVGGNVTWDFGDGNTSTNPNPSHIYATAGTYQVKMLAQAACLCDATITKIIEVIDCTVLPIENNWLAGELSELAYISLNWDVEGTFNQADLQKYVNGNWKTIQTFDYNESLNAYTHKDFEVLYDLDNVYRVEAKDYDGNVIYSNIAVVQAKKPSVTSVIVYPNPIENEQTKLQFTLAQDAMVEADLYNLLGQKLMDFEKTKLKTGVHQWKLDLNSLPKGSYILRAYVNDKLYSFKLLKLQN